MARLAPKLVASAWRLGLAAWALGCPTHALGWWRGAALGPGAWRLQASAMVFRGIFSRTKTWSCCFGHPRIGNPGVGLIYVQMPPSSDLRDAYRFAAFSLPSQVTFYSRDEATWTPAFLSFRIVPSPATLLFPTLFLASGCGSGLIVVAACC